MKNKIAEYRKLRGFTQEEMAEKLSVARKTYINYETSATEPSFDILIKISKILRTSIDDLLDNDIYPSLRDKTKEQIIKDIEKVLMNYK